MLMSKVYHNGIFIPRNDHYFFSLLFHSRVQKNRVKDQYKKILNQMAGELNFTWFNEAILTDDRAISELINGFFSASNYHFEYPIDQHVEINKRIASKLITRDLFTQKENFVLKKSKEILRKVLPHFIIQMLKN